MKKFIIIFTACIFCLYGNIYSQSWAQKIGGSGNDYSSGIAIDKSGNSFVAGWFKSDSLSFNNGVSLKSSGAIAAYIAKYNSNGLCEWAQKISGNSDDYANAIALDAFGNIYIGGDFSSDTLNFNNGITLINGGEDDAYIAKYSSSGVCQWAQSLGGKGDDIVNSLSLDRSGNIYMAGNTNSSIVNFNNGISLANSGYEDAYIAKYNSNGICEWAQKIAGAGFDEASGIAVDAKGSFYVSGNYYNSSLYLNNNISLSNSGGNDAFIAKYSNLGVCLWAQSISGAGEDCAKSIAIDSLGNVCVAGYFESAILNFNNSISLINDGAYDVFIAKYNESGACQWAQKISGSGYDEAASIVCDSIGNIFVAGYFNSPSIKPNSNIILTNGGYNDAFIAKYSPMGYCHAFKQINGAGDDIASSIGIDAEG